MFTRSPPPVVVCAENIALLYLLHSVPVSPSHNEINKPLLPRGNYSLSFSQEQILASILAFLSNTKDDSNHVPALCIEEDPKLTSLNVVLAVNRTNWEDGNEVLQNLKQSLERIFTILSEISKERGRSQSIEYHVFTAIVSMCSHRILSRLRFVPKKGGTPKQPLKVVLGEAIDSLKQLSQRTLHSLPVQLFTEKAKEVMRLADLWIKRQKPAELRDLVEGIYRLKQIGDLQALLDSIPNRQMCPSSRQNLVNIVNKVSRYREAARVLYRTAKRIPSLRRTKVILVNLPKEAFNRVSGESHTPQLTSTIARIGTIRQGPDIGSLCRLLNTSSPKLEDHFTAQTRKTLREAKIHAEIQLIFHYELNASKLPPRIVCSSKDACFLCNIFILMHGKMHMPRSHGRLYPGWRLPSMHNLKDLDLRFNSALENQLKDSLKILLSKQKKTTYPDPNESTLLTLPLSTSTLHTSTLHTSTLHSSTLHTSTLAKATKWEESSANNVLADDTARPLISPKDQVPVSSSEDVKSVASVLGSRSAITAAEDGVAEGFSDQHAMQLSSRCSPPTTRHKLTTSDVPELVQGVPQVSSIISTCKPQFHTAGGLELHIEYSAETVPVACMNHSEIIYSIEWLSVEESRELLDNKAATLIDVEALECQVSHELDCHNDILIMARGAFVRITPQRGGREREAGEKSGIFE